MNIRQFYWLVVRDLTFLFSPKNTAVVVSTGATWNLFASVDYYEQMLTGTQADVPELPLKGFSKK